MKELCILELYRRYKIPTKLQQHMLRAAAVSKLICDNWEGPPINESDILTTMLIHDIGNMVKIDFSRNSETVVGQDYQYWSGVRDYYIHTYGTDDHIITFNIAYELGLSMRILWLVINKMIIHNEMIEMSRDYELKICAYSDQRVGPDGVLQLEERFTDLKKRYSKREFQSRYPRSDYLIKSSYEIERQIMRYSRLRPTDITDKSISDILKDLSTYTLLITET